MTRVADTRLGRTGSSRVVRGFAAVGLGVLVGVLGACEEKSPTSIDPDGVPVNVRTVEVEIPWSEVGGRFESFGGFGSPSQIGTPLVAKDLGGLVDARALVRFQNFPTSVAVRDSTGVLVTDTLITIRSGELIVVADTVGVDSLTSWTFGVGVLDQAWDRITATWESAIDSVAGETAWDEPGAGPVRALGETTAVVAESGDSIRFDVDAATLAEWADSADSQRSVRIDLVSGVERVRLLDVVIRLEIGSAVAPDTTLFRTVPLSDETFIYTPEPDAPDGVVRAGGAPSWRTVLGLNVPSAVELPAEICELVGCPFALTAESLSRASLVLSSRATLPAAFQPVDSVLLDVRPVLAPDALPKSPLGNTLIGQATLGADAFGATPGESLVVPITEFVRAILEAEEGETPPTELALLSLLEPLDLSFVEFDGPDDAGAPRLRLLVTVSDPVTYR